MRYIVTHFSVTENLPECPACGTKTEFARSADLGKDGRMYLIFKCPACATETKVWRPEWQTLADTLAVEE